MLVLTRKVDESITVGTNITVTVLEIRGGQVRLGIEAPKQTPVHRTEVFRSIVNQNIEAANTPQDLSSFFGDGNTRRESAEGGLWRRDR
jgi:carbon storage regulator